MRYEAFAEALNAIRPDSGQVVSVWFEWAKEVGRMRYGRGPVKPHKTAEEFLDEFANSFHAIQERHGDEVAGRMISFSELSSCIFPWEMRLAAEYLAVDGDIHNILP